MSLAEVMTLNILRFSLCVHDLKTFHRLLQNAYREYFPALPNYENFLKVTNRSFPALVDFYKIYAVSYPEREVSGEVFHRFDGGTYISSHQVTREEVFRKLYDRHRHIMSAPRRG